MIWIARDNTELDNLYLYSSKPKLIGDNWKDDTDQGFLVNIPSEMYSEITFENSPYQLKVNKNYIKKFLETVVM